MDSFTLRQEISELTKQYQELKHRLIVGEQRMKELHEEEMKYLEEIPQYKKQAQDAKTQASEAAGKVAPLHKILNDAQEELVKSQGLVVRENQALNGLKETQKKIIEETKVINENIKQRHEQLKQRELAVADREKASELHEVGYTNRDSELTKGEVALEQRIAIHKKVEQELRNKIDIHNNNIESHKVKVDAFIEQKGFHEEDKIILQNNMAKYDKLVKEQIGMKSQLLLQAEKASKDIAEAERKQKMLDKAIDDLKNQENNLKLKELRVQKLIKDAGISKELKELEESLK